MQTLFFISAGLVVLLGFTVFFGAPYVPSKKRHLKSAFKELYRLSEKDTLLDLGSGDGVVLRAAAETGAKAIGYELNPLLCAISWWLSKGNAGIQVRCVNFWKEPFPSDVTVVYLFGDSRDIKKLTNKIQQESTRLQKSLHVISYGFSLPEYDAVKQQGAYHLYKISPLHNKKPQV